jgi:hypothetical protein
MVSAFLLLAILFLAIFPEGFLLFETFDPTFLVFTPIFEPALLLAI